MRIETELDGKTVGAIERHYLHAKEKHPYFSDALFASQLKYCLLEKDEERKFLCECLREARANNLGDAYDGNVLWSNLLDEEKWEVLLALIDGDTAAAVEECYDAIAVLLRVIDVLEGRQKLGRPEE